MTETRKALCVLTRVVDDSDPHWNYALTIVDTIEGLRRKFDLSQGVPYGWRLIRGKAAQRFLKWMTREEMKYQREQESKRRCAGNN